MSDGKQYDLIASLRKDSELSSHYQILELLGQGTFGNIVKVINIKTFQIVALKVQSLKKTKAKIALKNQANILKKLQNKAAVSKIYNHANSKHWSYIQLQMLDHDLSQVHLYSILEITELTVEILGILQAIHRENVIHQDLKPQNIMRCKDDQLYLIDFGLSKVLGQTKLPNITGFIGTPRYASVRAHNMVQQYKADDLQSLFYVIAYLYLRKLPWNNLNVGDQQKLERIKLSKLTHRKILFLDFPPQFQKAFNYITGLEPKAEPNYAYLKNFFKLNMNKEKGSLSPRTSKNHLNKTFTGTNLLQLPQPQFSPKVNRMPKLKPIKFGQSKSVDSNQHTNSSKSQAMNGSDLIISYLVQIFDDQEEMQSLRQSSVEDQDPHRFSGVMRSLTLKNPFI